MTIEPELRRKFLLSTYSDSKLSLKGDDSSNSNNHRLMSVPYRRSRPAISVSRERNWNKFAGQRTPRREITESYWSGLMMPYRLLREPPRKIITNMFEPITDLIELQAIEAVSVRVYLTLSSRYGGMVLQNVILLEHLSQIAFSWSTTPSVVTKRDGLATEN